MSTNKALALASWLPKFFDAYGACKVPLVKPEERPRTSHLDVTKLGDWLYHLRQPLLDARGGAFYFNPWEVAGLRRDEVRNSAVLGWLLNPKDSHGLGDAALRSLLKEVRQFDARFPATCGKSCSVRVESNPDGELGNRIDIEVDDEKFYLLLEIKIDAPEGCKQMERYGAMSEAIAGNRPWVLVFLTPQGRDSQTAGPYGERVLAMTWRRLAFRVAQTMNEVGAGAVLQKSPDRYMAERAVQRFLKQMRNF